MSLDESIPLIYKNFEVISSKCVEYVANYLNEDQFISDYDAIAANAIAFAKTVKIAGDGNDS